MSEAKKGVRDRHYEAEVERSATGELQAKAAVMSADCATQLRAADALRGAIKQLNAAAEVLKQARTLEDTAAACNVTTVNLEKQASVAQGKVQTRLCPRLFGYFCEREATLFLWSRALLQLVLYEYNTTSSDCWIHQGLGHIWQERSISVQVDAAAMQLQALQEAGREDEAAAHSALLTRLHRKLLKAQEALATARTEEEAAGARAAAEFARARDLDERSARLKMMGESMAAEIDQLKVVRDLQVRPFWTLAF